MDLKNLENNRWKSTNQKLVFRHKAALDMIKEKSKVLDLGCGDGLFMTMLKEKDVDCKGIDISDEAVRKCIRKKLNSRTCNISKGHLPFGDEEFDYVVLLDILEHLYNPGVVIKEASRISKRLIISVPNFNSIAARWQVVLGEIPENNRHSQGHLYWFNYKVLSSLLIDNQLEIDVMDANTIWSNKFFVGTINNLLLKIWPNLFALSFVVKTRKIDK